MRQEAPFEPRLLATAIGSVPHHDADDAVSVIFETLPDAPFWPQLPRADWREGMMAQFVEGLPGAVLDPARRRVGLDIEAATFGIDGVERAAAAGDLGAFGISADFARGYHAFCRRLATAPPPQVVKGHVTGPVTLALALETNFEDRPAIYEPDLARLVARVVGLKARVQEEAFATLAPGAQRLIFFDEPSLGSIGSAVLNLDADLAVELLSIAAASCRGLAGIHCCGETDLGLVVEAGVKVLNFDAFDYLDSVAAAGKRLRTFLEDEGGMLAIGLVPSSLPHPEAIAGETFESLWARLLGVLETLEAAGMDRELVARRSFLTPSCGTGGMSPQNARRSLELTARLAAAARRELL
jgi:methionine synthase II (cobalamin-independent)